MKCPYCAEDINDAAVVCRHCGRDFQLLKPLIEKITGLELQLDALREQLAQFGTTARTPSKRIPTSASAWLLLAAIALSVVGSNGLYWLFVNGEYEKRILLFGSITFPALVGLIVGLRRVSSRIASTLAIGALIGLLDLIGTLLIYHGSFWPSLDDVLEVVGMILLGQTLLFTFSHYFGSFLAKRMKLVPLSEGGSDRVAIALAQITNKTNSNNAKDIEFWKTILASLTPIFTLVGTSVTAYFTYLAALAKQ